MFSPKMPSLFVLIGDEASREAEHLVSVLVDHAEEDRYSLMQVICLWQTNQQSIMNDQRILVSHYLMDDLPNRFSAIVRDRRNDIMSNVGETVAANIQHGKQYVAFVAKGLSAPAQYVLDLRDHAQRYIAASGCRFLSQFCFLAEDDPIFFKDQRQWIMNPDNPAEIHPGFHSFDQFLLLTRCNERGIRNYQTQLQMEGAFAVGLLYMASGETHTDPLYTMRFGKINGSSYDLFRIQQDVIVETLRKWSSHTLTATEGWEVLSTDTVALKEASGKEVLSDVLHDDLVESLPSLSDLAAIGMDQKNLSCADLILSFDALNEDSFYTQKDNREWADRWVSDVCQKLARYPYLEGLITLLEAEGAIGQAIRTALADADERFNKVGAAEQWLRKQWTRIELPGHKLLQSAAAYNLITLREYYIAYQNLCHIRGLKKRLAAMEEARKSLLTFAKARVCQRDAYLDKFRLPDNEKTVLYSLCEEYTNKVRQSAGQTNVEDMVVYKDAVQYLYNTGRLEKSWEQLMKELAEKTTQRLTDNKKFGEAFAMNKTPSALRDRILQHQFNDATLLPQLFSDLPEETPTVFYPVPDAVYRNLPNSREQDGFVPIHGDVIERVTFVPLGGIDKLYRLNLFSEITFDVPPQMVAPVTIQADNSQEEACDGEAARLWNIKLADTGKNWVLSWTWVGNRDEATHITWPAYDERISKNKWHEGGQMLVLAPDKIPFGRFAIKMECGAESTCIETDGRQLRIKLILDRKSRSPLLLPDGQQLPQAVFHLEGQDLSIVRGHQVLLKKKNGVKTFLYDLFATYTMDDLSTKCIAYCEDSGTLSLEGDGQLTGFVDVPTTKRGDEA